MQAHNRALREEARVRREYERELATAQRLQARATAESNRAEKALKVATAHVQTAAAQDALEQIDSILSATLDVDDYVDLDSLKQKAQHPPFPREDLKMALPQPALEQPPAEPQFVAPPAPTGLTKMFKGGKYSEEYARAQASWTEHHKRWADYVQRVLPAKNAKLLEEHAAAEQKRARQLADALSVYEAECAERECR